MSSELLITQRDNKILSIQREDDRIVQIHAQDAWNRSSHLGDIYVGKVRNVVKNLNAAFVEYSKGQMGYLSLNDPKVAAQTIHTDGFPGHQPGRILIGDEIVVQVSREAVKTKPPTLSGLIDLTGRYMVMTMGRPQTSISRKIGDKDAKVRLLQLMEDYHSDAFGWIARTNAAQVDEEILRLEMEALVKRREEICQYGVHKAMFTCLYQAPTGYLCDIRDGYGSQVERILTDQESLYTSIQDYMSSFQPEDLDKLTLWNPEHGKMDAVYNISRTLDHALMPKVWLKSGAYLVIQPTEALISIDVNTGKAISKKKDVQKNFQKVNIEAAYEIAHQLRLRNLSGMILIDFIDLDSQEAQEELLHILKAAVRPDPVQTVVVDLTKLGLVEVTRKKVRRSLYEQMKETEEK